MTRKAVPSPDPVRSQRVSLTLPRDLADDILKLSKVMGMSQSALVTTLMQVPVKDLLKVVGDGLPDRGDEKAMKRFRGKSIETILKRVAEVWKEL